MSEHHASVSEALSGDEAGEEETEIRRLTWERYTEWPLTVSAVLFLGAYAWPILDTGLAHRWRALCYAITLLCWLFFAIDYFVRLSLSVNRFAFFRQHLLDLAVALLPAVQPLYLLRLVILLRVLNRKARGSLRGRVMVYVVLSTVVFVFVAALAELQVERPARGSNIHTFGDSVWWALTTVTTVGYGDYSPVTFQGRVIGATLMFFGVALAGVVTAAFASWLVDRVSEQDDDDPQPSHDLAELRDEVRQLRALLEEKSEKRHDDHS